VLIAAVKSFISQVQEICESNVAANKTKKRKDQAGNCRKDSTLFKTFHQNFTINFGGYFSAKHLPIIPTAKVSIWCTFIYSPEGCYS
jgi:hypothetical protein